MSLLYGLLWRFLLALVHANRGLVSWFRARLPCWKDGLWQGIRTALLLPLTLIGVSDQPKKRHQNPGDTGTGAVGRSWRWQSDLACLEKLPVHIGLLVTEEELSYTDIATLVVWCMAVGISYISVYDTCGIFQKKNSCVLEEIIRQQQELLGVDPVKYNVGTLSSDSDSLQHHVVSCRPTVKLLSSEDGKQRIVQAAQQLCRSVEKKAMSSKDINVSMLDIILRDSRKIPDPDLVLKFGPVDSTLGFLPWHIRLTEFISLPSHKNVSYEQLLGALQRYGSFHQRLGQ